MYRKALIVAALLFGMSLVSGAAPKTLTSDPLTGLPLIPSTDSRLHLGNEPTVLPESQICKSKMASDFYAVFDSKFKDTVSWYDAHLTGFKKARGYIKGRSQTTFYKSDGSVIVSLTAEPGPDGADVNTYSVLYAKFTPGLPEKTIIGITSETIACP